MKEPAMPEVGKLRYRGQDTAWVPLLGRQVEPDEQVEVPVGLLDPREYAWSPDLWDVVDDAGAADAARADREAAYRARTADQLREVLAGRDLDTEGLKDELVARLVDADTAGGA